MNARVVLRRGVVLVLVLAALWRAAVGSTDELARWRRNPPVVVVAHLREPADEHLRCHFGEMYPAYHLVRTAVPEDALVYLLAPPSTAVVRASQELFALLYPREFLQTVTQREFPEDPDRPLYLVEFDTWTGPAPPGDPRLISEFEGYRLWHFREPE
jgi:hypothetical protein